MRQTVFIIVVVLMVVAAGTEPAAAQTSNATLNASVSGLARLSISSATLSFPDADPDAVLSIAASQGPLTLSAKARTSQNGEVTLTVVASDQLRSGINTIPVSNITWTATGAGFTSGTVSAVAAQTVAAWTGSGVHTGTQTYFFKNLWSYATGIYTVTMTYTLTAA